MNETVEELNEAAGPIPTWARRGLLGTAGSAIVAALVLVTIAFVIADAATDNLLVTPFGGDTAENITLGVVVFTAVFGGLVGTGLAWAMSRFVPRPRPTFVAVCVIGLLVYGIVPFTAAEETATAVWLNVMHLAVAVPVVGGLATWLQDTRA